MNYLAVSVTYLDGYRLQIQFADGSSGVFDMEPWIKRGGGYAPLKDLSVFKQVKLNPDFGVLTWHDEIDIAPEIVYAEATGKGLPEWSDTVRKTKVA